MVRLTDSVGNVTETTVVVALALAGAEGGPPIRGVHASGYTWATPVLKDPIMDDDRGRPHQHGRDRPEGRGR